MSDRADLVSGDHLAAMLDLFAGSVRRWRYPHLAAVLQTGALRPDGRQAVGLLLDGLAAPERLDRSMARLIDEGSFGVVEELLLELIDTPQAWQGDLDETDLDALGARLAQAQSDAEREAWGEWTTLDARATEVGLDEATRPPWEATTTGTDNAPRAASPSLRALVVQDRSAAKELLAGWRDAVAAAEGRRAADLEERLRAAAPDEQAPGTGAWVEAVRSCLDAREFRVAESLLAAGPVRGTGPGPRAVAAPPWRWPWPDRPAAEVLSWYGIPLDRRRWPGPEVGRYLPAADDARAADVVAALAGLIDDGASEERMWALTVALTQLLGNPCAAEVRTMPGGYLGRLFGVHDERLPHLTPVSADGLAVWVSRPDLSPHDPAARPPAGIRPVVWLRPETSPPLDEDASVAVLGVADLLLVLAPAADGTTDDPGRRAVNLLRRIVFQFSTEVLLGPGGLVLGRGAAAREGLAWLFDLLQVNVEAAVLDGLIHDSGGHAGALRVLVEDLLRTDDPGPGDGPGPGRGPGHAHGHGRPRQVTVEDLRRTRRRIPGALRDAVLPAAEGALVPLLLWTVVTRMPPDPFGPEQARKAVHDVLRDRTLAGRAAGPAAVAVALDRLTASGLLRRDGEKYLPPAASLQAVLVPTASEAAVQYLTDAATALRQEVAAADHQLAAEHGRAVTHLIGHRVDNDVIAVLGVLDRTRDAVIGGDGQEAVLTSLDTAGTRVQQLGSGAYVELYESAFRPAEVVDLGEVVDSLVGEMEWELPAQARLDYRRGEPCPAVVTPIILEEALRNLIRNGVQSVAARPRPDRAPIVVVSVGTVAASDEVVRPEYRQGSGTLAVITVTDNGTGFAAAELGRLAHALSPQAPMSARAGQRARHGQGLAMTAALLRRFSGWLQVDNDRDWLGGGRARMFLPAAER